MRTGVEVVVGHNIARVGCSRLVVGPCIACSLRSRVAPAPEILCFAPLSIAMKQEPLKTKQARNLTAACLGRYNFTQLLSKRDPKQE